MTAPVVVVAPVDDVAAQLTAASAAVALGAPVLLTGPATDAAPVLAELDRLDAEAVLAVGAVTLTPPSGVTVVPVAAGAGADALRAATGARFGAPTEVPAGQEAGTVRALAGPATGGARRPRSAAGPDGERPDRLADARPTASVDPVAVTGAVAAAGPPAGGRRRHRRAHRRRRRPARRARDAPGRRGAGARRPRR